MSDLKTAEDFVNSKKIQKYIEQIDTDADDAMSLADSVISSAVGKLYSSSTLSTYKADVSRLDRSWGDFNGAWNKVTFGRAKNGKELTKTYTKYVLSLEILEAANARHGAVLTSGIATVIATFHALVLKLIKEKKKKLEALYAELLVLKKLLEKAKREVKEAAAQAALNAGLTAVTLLMGPVGWGARIGVAVGSMALHHIIDASLGPSRGSVAGSLNTVAGDTASLVDKLSKGQRTFGGAVSGVVTLGLDASEIGDAVKIVDEVKKRMKVVSKQLDKLLRDAQNWARDTKVAEKNYRSALSAYDAASKKVKKASQSRKQLLKEFKAWK